MKVKITLFILLMALFLCSCQVESNGPKLDKDGNLLQGFHTQDGKIRYFMDGVAKFGWQTVDGKTYYLDSSGVCIGWQKIGSCQYYFDASGAMQTGWLEENGKRYFFGDNGIMHTGWLGEDTDRCYLGNDGALVTGWLSLDEGNYLLDENGVPLTGWQDHNADRYYFSENGIMYTGWLEYEGDKYYFLDDGRMAKGEVELNGSSWFFTSKGKNVLIVNFRCPLPGGYAPELASWRNITLEKNALEAVKTMILDGEAIQHQFWLNSAYRTVEDQKDIWNSRYEKHISEGYTPEQAYEMVATSVAKPGTSEHHTGLAVDIDGTWASLDWMANNAWKYGLIVRYPEGKTEFTGIIYEPWHFRYVGVELAKELYESGLCMEEYMQKLTNQQGR